MPGSALACAPGHWAAAEAPVKALMSISPSAPYQAHPVTLGQFVRGDHRLDGGGSVRVRVQRSASDPGT